MNDRLRERIPLHVSAGPDRGAAAGAGEGVDRPVERRWKNKHLLAAAGVGAVLCLAGLTWRVISAETTVRADWAALTTATVEQRPFQEYIAITGRVLPKTTVYVDAVEGGRVEEVFVTEGELVAAGQPLLRLSNNDLRLRLLAVDAQRIEQMGRLQDTRHRSEESSLAMRQQMLDLDYELIRLRRVVERLDHLHARGLVPTEELEKTVDELAFLNEKRVLTLAGQRQDSIRTAAQLRQLGGAVERMEHNFQAVREILEELVVRAPVAGQLTGFQAEVGSLRSGGARFGQIDVLDGIQLRAAIEEFYISRVEQGQVALASVGSQSHPLRITRIDPEVREGRFELDLEFQGTPPEGLRRGQTVRGRLELDAPRATLVLPRGSFYQQTGGNWVFVIQEGRAVRRPVRFGLQNPEYFEVVAGLEAGEQVIVSSYAGFGEAAVVLPR
jgi:HlyD family secretion protein